MAAEARYPQITRGSTPTIGRMHDPLLEPTGFLPCGPRFRLGQDSTGLGFVTPDSVEGLLSPSNRMGLMTSAGTMGLLNDSRIGLVTSTVNMDGLLTPRTRTGLLTSRSTFGLLDCNAGIGLKTSSDTTGLLAAHNMIGLTTSTACMEGILSRSNGIGLMASRDRGGFLAGNNGSRFNASSDTLRFLNDNRIKLMTSTASRERLLSPSNRMGLMSSKSTSGLLESSSNGLGLGPSSYVFDSRGKVSGNVATPSVTDIEKLIRCSAEINSNNKGRPHKSF